MSICYQRKLLLISCWLVGDVNLVREKNTVDWLADKATEQSELSVEHVPKAG